MDLFEAIKGRKSIRSFKSKPVSDSDIDKILNAAIQAPSAGNLQPWEFVIVKNKDTKEKISKTALGQYFIIDAPVVIVVCADKNRTGSKYGKRGKELYCIQDCANATMLLQLAAHSLGLGTVWVGTFNESKIKKILSLPENVMPLAIVPLGYPNDNPGKPRRIPLEKVLHREEF